MKLTKAKAYAAALGATATALMTALATAQTVLDDGALDATEYGLIATAAVTLLGTVYAVWRVPNVPATSGVTVRSGPAPY
jgi:hypothetical protein